MPLCVSRAVEDPVHLKSSLDLEEAPAIRILREDSPDGLRLFRVDDKAPLLVLRIPEKPFMVDLYLPLLVSELDPEAARLPTVILIPAAQVTP